MELDINYLAVGAAALVAFLVGGLWYSPVLFGKVWARENKLSDEDLRSGNVALVFGGSFVLALVMSLNLAAFIGQAGVGFAAMAGFAAGFGWVAAGMGITYLFERRSRMLFFIDAGYHVVTMTLMGVILGLWK